MIGGDGFDIEATRAEIEKIEGNSIVIERADLHSVLDELEALRKVANFDLLAETVRLRSLIDALVQRGNVTGAAVDFVYRGHTFTRITICAPTHAGEMAIAERLAELMKTVGLDVAGEPEPTGSAVKGGAR